MICTTSFVSMAAIGPLEEENQNKYASECCNAYVTTDGMQCINRIE